MLKIRISISYAENFQDFKVAVSTQIIVIQQIFILLIFDGSLAVFSRYRSM